MENIIENLIANWFDLSRGNIVRLARHLGVSRQAVHCWRTRKIPHRLVLEVSAFTGIPPDLLRPDLARIVARRTVVPASQDRQQ